MSENVPLVVVKRKWLIQSWLSIRNLLRLWKHRLHWRKVRHRVSEWEIWFKSFRKSVQNLLIRFSSITYYFLWSWRASILEASKASTHNLIYYLIYIKTDTKVTPCWAGLKECVCDPGLHGPRCNSKCDDTNCVHGGCVDRCVHYDNLDKECNWDHICVCDDGWFGQYCSTPTKCIESEVNNLNSFYIELWCAFQIQCQNGASCDAHDWLFNECNCLGTGHHGSKCELSGLIFWKSSISSIKGL